MVSSLTLKPSAFFNLTIHAIPKFTPKISSHFPTFAPSKTNCLKQYGNTK